MSASRPSSLPENAGLVFIGEQSWPAARLTAREAKLFVSAQNPSGRPNTDVLRDFVSLASEKITEAPQIDFPPHFTEQEASLYQEPFNKLRTRNSSSDTSESASSGRRPCRPAPAHAASVASRAISQARRPVATSDHRTSNTSEKDTWWISPHANADLRNALARLDRFLVAPVAAEIPTWNWIDSHVLPDASLLAVARDDDFTFGILQSRLFRCWWRQYSAQLSPIEIVFSFPFPWPPTTLLSALNRTQEEQRHALARAARSENQEQIDSTVAAAYGWSNDLADDEILALLVKRNHERAQR